MTYGTWQLAGTQYSTPAGGTYSLGPFAVAFGPVTESVPVSCANNATYAIPANSYGVAIIPPIGNTTPSIQISFSSYANASGNYIAPGTPTVIAFDTAHTPANLYLVAGGSVTVQVQNL